MSEISQFASSSIDYDENSKLVHETFFSLSDRNQVYLFFNPFRSGDGKSRHNILNVVLFGVNTGYIYSFQKKRRGKNIYRCTHCEVYLYKIFYS